MLNLSNPKIFLTDRVRELNQVKIVPKSYHDSIKAVDERESVAQAVQSVEVIAGIDISLNNLALITSNQKGVRPSVINGKPLNSINAYYLMRM